MSIPESPVTEFVVEVDQAAVLKARTRMFKLAIFSAWIGLVSGGIIIAFSIFSALVFHTSLILITGISGIILLIDGVYKLRKIGKKRQELADIGVAPVAMRLSAAGLRCSIDSAPDSIFLPWNTVAGFRLVSWRGKQLLALDLATGVTPSTPGVIGLDHPEVQLVLHRKRFGAKGLRVAVSILKQPLGAIDQALAYFSNGQVRIR